MTNPVENFTIKRDITNDLLLTKIENNIENIFTIGISIVTKNFEFDFSIPQIINNQVKITKVKNDTEWFLDDQKRVINCFYPFIHDQKVFLSFLYKEQQYTVPMEKNNLYFLPSWMTYKFINKSDLEIEVGQFWYFSDKKIIYKNTGTYW